MFECIIDEAIRSIREREEEDETGGGQDGEKESTAQRVFLFSFKAEHWEAGEAGEMFRGCRSSERLSSWLTILERVENDSTDKHQRESC